MPEVEEREGFLKAIWKAILDEEDRKRTHFLAGAMPPACRAYLPSGEAPSPLELILGFLDQAVDSLVRQSLAQVSLLPSHHGRFKSMLAEKWLRALSSLNPIFIANSQECTSFLQEIQPWLSGIEPTSLNTAFRTCFRLEPPQDGEEWGVDFLLQANDDPSLIVPAEEVWRTKKSILTFLKRRFENPQERLLADLGRACRIFPVIEQSLREACPVGLRLDTEQAYTFLRQWAPLLEQSGFGVLIPSWWQKPQVRVGLKLKARPKLGTKVAGSGLFGVDSIVDYSWEVAIGGETLSPQEFERLAQLKVPLVQVRGQWVELRPSEVEKAISFFQKHVNGAMRLGEALRLGLGREEAEVGLPVVGVEGEGWVSSILGELKDGVKMASVEPSPSFCGELRPYQKRGLSWLSFLKKFGLGACLADDMGLGKTIQVIALLLRGRNDGSTLVVCPMSVVGNWQHEVQRFAPSLQVMVHHGVDRLAGQEFREETQRNDLVITTYSLVYRDMELFSQVSWGCVVLDEAQNIKNAATKQTQAVRKLKADHYIALTGTPVENRLSDLWSIMECLNPGYLGSAKDFHTHFVLPIERYHNPERSKVLQHLIQPFVLRRVKTDPQVIQDLPQKVEMKVFYHLTSEQASLYEAVVQEMMERIEDSEGIERKGLVLATLTKLKQVCNHPAHFLQDGSQLSGRSGKLTRLMELLEEILTEGDKALIFTQFAEMGSMLRHHLQETFGCEVFFLYGGSPKKERDRMISRFQNGGPPLFILSLKAGGLGLNLTAANHVFHFDRWWNPAVENQATDRAFRIGQKRNVLVHKFICLGTLEERIDQLMEEKRGLADSIVGGGEKWLTEMSTDRLREMFALSHETVEE
jgi:SNF2 family DNA or RNA helicase